MRQGRGRRGETQRIKVLSIECGKVEGDIDTAAVRKEWFAVGDAVARAKNLCSAAWFADRAKLERPVKEFLPKELGRAIYDLVRRQWLDELAVKGRVIDLALNRWRQDMGVAASGINGKPVKRWNAILNHGTVTLPSYRSPQPIPFDKANSRLVLTADRSQLIVGLRPDSGHTWTINLWTKQLRGFGRETLKRIADGTYTWRGSTLEWRASCKKWFAVLCYTLTAETAADLDPARIGVLQPTADADKPLLIHEDGENAYSVIGDGSAVYGQRRRLIAYRKYLNAQYRHARSATRAGHGRKRALQPLEKTGHLWARFMATLTHTASKRAVEWCVRNGVGRLVYVQPASQEAKDCLPLERAGSHESDRWRPQFDWSGLQAKLTYKCSAAGVALEIVKATSSELLAQAYVRTEQVYKA